MQGTTVLDLPAPPSRRTTLGILALTMVLALTFFGVAALPYLISSEYNAELYADKRIPLLLHILGGTVALLTGPIQLWLGLADRRMHLHRKIGVAYMLAVGASSIGAFYLATHPSGGYWVFGAGLAGLAVAWVTTTGMAFLAIKRSLITDHKEWMIRSYVVTFAFVLFRIGYTALQALHIGTPEQQLSVMAWSCWAVPLLVNELIMQGRKILAVRV
jgi:Predicted membrane protein (DUF2306)